MLVVATLLWSHMNARAVPRIMGAEPLASPELEAQFESVLSGAKCRRPRLSRVGARGGYWVNAMAVPSLQTPGVVFTNDLLDALTPAETRAIFAHEVAHLEYFDRMRLIKRALVMAALAVILLVVVVKYGPQSAVISTLTWVWPLVVLAVLAMLVAGNQAREHESDVRAVELVGEPESLISALTKIHDLMRMPRRWRSGSEARMSHPSLAKRLRAIREAAGVRGIETSESGPIDVIVLRSADDSSEAVVMAEDRIHWLKGLEPDAGGDATALLAEARDCRSIRYDDLTDLRLEVQGVENRFLTAIDGSGNTLKLALSADDVSRAKANLERIDLEVKGTAPGAAKELARQQSRRRSVRIWATAAALFGVVPPIALSLLLAGLLAAARPTRATLAVAGAIAIASGIVGLRLPDPSGYVVQTLPFALAVEIVIGVILLYYVSRWANASRTEERRGTLNALALTGALAVLYLLLGISRLGSPLPVMRLHTWTRYEIGLTLALFGLAAALWSTSSSRLRPAAIAAAALAVLLIATGTLWFRDRFGDDALAIGMTGQSSGTLAPQVARELTIDGHVIELKISPSGGRIATLAFDIGEGYSGGGGSFQVERAGGGFHSMSAADVEFVDDDRVALLSYGNADDLLLQVVDIEPTPTVVHEVALPEVIDPDLRLDPESGRWLTLFSVNAGARALWASSSYDYDLGLGYLTYTLNPYSMLSVPTEVWSVDESGGHRLALTTLSLWCAGSLAGQTRFICASNDRELNTRIWSIDVAGGRFEPVATLRGQYYEGRLSSNMLLLTGYGVPTAMVGLESGLHWTLDLGERVADEVDRTEDEIGPTEWLLSWLLGAPDFGSYIMASAIQQGIVGLAFGGDETTRIVVLQFN